MSHTPLKWFLLTYRLSSRNLVFAWFSNETMFDRETQWLFGFYMLNSSYGNLRIESVWREINCYWIEVIGTAASAELHCASRWIRINQLDLPLKNIPDRVEVVFSWNEFEKLNKSLPQINGTHIFIHSLLLLSYVTVAEDTTQHLTPKPFFSLIF